MFLRFNNHQTRVLAVWSHGQWTEFSRTPIAQGDSLIELIPAIQRLAYDHSGILLKQDDVAQISHILMHWNVLGLNGQPEKLTSTVNGQQGNTIWTMSFLFDSEKINSREIVFSWGNLSS